MFGHFVRQLSLLWIIISLSALQIATAQNPGSLRLNEIMSSNSATIADEDGDFEDWIELYNAGTTAINLEGYGLSDNYSQPFKWVLPDVQIGPGEFLVIWASGKNRIDPASPLHTNYGISAAGEEVLLTHPEGTRLDSLPPVRIPTDVSIGRKPDGTFDWYFFTEPTPGQRNSDNGYLGFTPPVQWSHNAGFYADPFELLLSHPDSQVRIYYTTDGSTPTASSSQFTVPLTIQDRSSEPNVVSMIPTNNILPQDNARRAWYVPQDLIRKATIIRTKTVLPGYLPSYSTSTYFIYPDGVNTFGLPVFSVVTDAEHFFSDERGIYVPGNTYEEGDDGSGNYYERGPEWERPVSLELFENGHRVLNQGAGVRIHGAWTRRLPIKSLRFYARNENGDPYFRYPLFPDQPYDQYRRFILRASGNDWRHTYFRDAAAQSLAKHLNLDTQAYRPAILYINGEYWGIKNIRERYDQYYLQRVYDIDPKNVDYLTRTNTVEIGDRVHFDSMMNIINRRDMSDPSNFAEAITYFDPDNLLDFYAIQLYCGNNDWPHNNQDFWRSRVPYDPYALPGQDGRFRWMLYDLDRCLGYSTDSDFDSIEWILRDHRSTQFIRGLLENTSFKYAFINRINDHLNTAFTPNFVTHVIDSLQSGIEVYINEHMLRWGQPRSIDEWHQNVEVMRRFAAERPTFLRGFLSSHFGIGDQVSIQFSSSDEQMGYIEINSIPITAAQPGVPDQPYPWTGTYFSGIPITIQAKQKPGFQFVSWAGDIESNNPVLTITPSRSKNITAVFEIREGEPEKDLIHKWDFNELPSGVLSEVLADFSQLNEAVITYMGDGDGYMDRVSPGTERNAFGLDEPGYALRVRNPSADRALIFHTPSTGFERLSFSYAVNRTNNGAERQVLYYNTGSDTEWIRLGEPYSITAIADSFEVRQFDITNPSAFNNQELAFRIKFGGEQASGNSGNNRFDNVQLTGIRTSGSTLPPQVIESIPFTSAIVGNNAHSIALDAYFTASKGSTISYEATSSNPSIVEVMVSGDDLMVEASKPGDATITVSASDGIHAPVSSSFRVLAYPEPHRLADGRYEFTSFNPDQPEYTYPASMIFLQSDVSDPADDAELLFPYFIPHGDYADDDLPVGFPYNNSTRTRISGLNDDGVGFINTGRGRDVGGALLALDTEDTEEVKIEWLTGTNRVNSRKYGLRLQYRTSINDTFEDLLINGNKLEYISSDTEGHTQLFGPVLLPDELLNQRELQLLWRYYYISGSGSRAKIRLDDIKIWQAKETSLRNESELPKSLELYQNYPNPFNPVTQIRFGLPSSGMVTLSVFNTLGQLITILKSESMSAGFHTVNFNGSQLSSGVYIYRLQFEGDTRTTQMVLIK